MGVFRNFPIKKDKEEVTLFEEKQVNLGPMLDLLLLDTEPDESILKESDKR
jgi:hypothetical protein